MRVLALISDGFGVGGGIAEYNRNFLTALAASSGIHEVVVLPRYATGDTGLPNRIVQLSPSAGRFGWALRALGALSRQRVDAIFCGHLYAAPLAAALSAARGLPLWIQVHGIEAWTPRGCLVERAVARARLVTAVSRYTRARMLSWSNIDPARVRVLPNTLSRSYSPGKKPDELVRRLGLAGKRIILTVGRLAQAEAYKGHDRIIEALAEVRQQAPDAVYVIAGDGDDVPRLKSMARRLAISEHVVFAGHVPSVQLPDYFHLADVFAMPSTGEGFGIVFLEAMASGIPVIGGAKDGSVDALADGELGILVDPENRAEIIKAIRKGLDGELPRDPGRASRFAYSSFANHVDGLVKYIQ